MSSQVSANDLAAHRNKLIEIRRDFANLHEQVSDVIRGDSDAGTRAMIDGILGKLDYDTITTMINDQINIISRVLDTCVLDWPPKTISCSRKEVQE
ncbi:hypothetical protein [uncultured Duncaniella sp.]|uniref:hypothetical protein n=1 Tax=uncultured Duncaniella sp. TaxID=2768039 RepID=UPI00261FD4A5|nr:hypothetical protein [uncultured Duncaniella sp.]